LPWACEAELLPVCVELLALDLDTLANDPEIFFVPGVQGFQVGRWGARGLLEALRVRGAVSLIQTRIFGGENIVQRGVIPLRDVQAAVLGRAEEDGEVLQTAHGYDVASRVQSHFAGNSAGGRLVGGEDDEAVSVGEAKDVKHGISV
jgi:hypothetical protein